MNLLIIGPEKRAKTEISLVQSAKKYFGKVLYAPITGIRVESDENAAIPFFKSSNLLKFDVVLCRIPKESRDFGFVLAKIFEENGKYLPIGYKAIILGTSEFLLPIFLNLKNCGLRAPKTYFACSRTAMRQSIDEAEYPVRIRLPYQKEGAMIADSKSVATGIIDTMEKLDQPILIQAAQKRAKRIKVLVVGDNVYALKDKKKHSLKTSESKILSETAKALGAEICQMNIVLSRNKILSLGINVSPKLMAFKKEFGEAVFDNVFSKISENASIFYEANPLFRFLNWVKQPPALQIPFSKELLKRNG